MTGCGRSIGVLVALSVLVPSCSGNGEVGARGGSPTASPSAARIGEIEAFAETANAICVKAERKINRAPISLERPHAYLDHMEMLFRRALDELRRLESPPKLEEGFESLLYLYERFPRGMRRFFVLHEDIQRATKYERAASAIIQTTELNVLFQCDDLGLARATDLKLRLLERYLDEDYYDES